MTPALLISFMGLSVFTLALRKLTEAEYVDAQSLNALHCTAPVHTWILLLMCIPYSYLPFQKELHAKFIFAHINLGLWSCILISYAILWLLASKYLKKYNRLWTTRVPFHKTSSWIYLGIKLIFALWGILILFLSTSTIQTYKNVFYRLPFLLLHWFSIQIMVFMLLFLIFAQNIHFFQHSRRIKDKKVLSNMMFGLAFISVGAYISLVYLSIQFAISG